MAEDLLQHYEVMWEKTIKLFERDMFEVDQNIESNNDTRRGLSLIIKFPPESYKEIESTICRLQAIAPEQFYYNGSTLHITVLSVISCQEGFLLNHINIQEYIDVITKAVKHVNPFNIVFKGITASPSCILLQGFPENDELFNLRESLREEFVNVNLKNTMDSRYKLITAHSTICRFQQPLNAPDEFISLLKELRRSEFLNLHVNELHLVYNDWYHNVDNTVVLSKITL